MTKFRTNFPPLIDMEIDWTNYDVNLLQHEVPLSDMKEWTSTSKLTQPVSDCSEYDSLVPVLVNPSKGYLSIPYHFKLVKLFLCSFHELK